jgi:hypothetical protein
VLPAPFEIFRICAIAAVPLLAAGLLLKHGRVAWACLVGIGLIIAMELYFFWDMSGASRACIQRTCLAAGRPPDCEPYFGCTEGNGIAAFLFWTVGSADAMLLTLGALTVALRNRMRRNLAE